MLTRQFAQPVAYECGFFGLAAIQPVCPQIGVDEYAHRSSARQPVCRSSSDSRDQRSSLAELVRTATSSSASSARKRRSRALTYWVRYSRTSALTEVCSRSAASRAFCSRSSSRTEGQIGHFRFLSSRSLITQDQCSTDFCAVTRANPPMIHSNAPPKSTELSHHQIEFTVPCARPGRLLIGLSPAHRDPERGPASCPA